MFKRAQNTPLSSWAITDLTIIVAWCYLPGLYSVFADQQQQQSDPAIPLWWLCKYKCKMGLKKRFTRSVFYWVVCWLACLHNSDKDMSRLSSSLPWLPDPMIDWLIIIEGPCSCSCSPWSSCTKHRPALINQHSDQGKAPLERKWRWIQQDSPDQARSCRIRLHAACCMLCLFVPCLISLCSRIPGLHSIPWFPVGMTRLMFYVLRIHLHTHACVHRYLDWTGN